MELFKAMSDDYIDRFVEWFGLQQSKRDEIVRNYHSPSQIREASLDFYATDHPYPSWRTVAEALRSADLHHQANVVESTYVQGTILHRSLHASDNFFLGVGLALCAMSIPVY